MDMKRIEEVLDAGGIAVVVNTAGIAVVVNTDDRGATIEDIKSATATKDPQCIAIYDDRAVAVGRDSGVVMSPEPADLVLRGEVR